MFNFSAGKSGANISDVDSMSQNRQSMGKRPNSIKRMATNMMNMFQSSKKQNAAEVGSQGDFQQEILPSIEPQNVLTNLNTMKKQRENHIQKNSTRGIQGIHFDNKEIVGGKKDQQENQNLRMSDQIRPNYPHSQAAENEKKGFQGMGQGLTNIISNFKKPASQKSGGGKSNKSGGGGSVCTSLSDLEKIEKIMNEAVHADKSIVKYFGKHLEEFRRDMHYSKEIIFSDVLAGFGPGLEAQEAEEIGSKPPRVQIINTEL